MARLRTSTTTADTSGVPAELLDQRHPVWNDAVLFAEWVRRHGGGHQDRFAGGFPQHWAARHRAATEAWALSVDLVDATGRVDRQGLDQLGIPWSGALAHAWSRAETFHG